MICALLLVGVVTRATLWFDYSSSYADYYPHIYYATVCRFDEFLPGIAVAMLIAANSGHAATATDQGKAAEPLISRKLKKRTVPKADGRYIVYYERA